MLTALLLAAVCTALTSSRGGVVGNPCIGLRDSSNATANADKLSACLDGGGASLSGTYPVNRGVVIAARPCVLSGFHTSATISNIRDQLQYVGAVTTASVITVKGSGAGSIIEGLWVNGNGRIGSLTGEAVVVSLGAGNVTVRRCKLTGATFPSPFVWQAGSTRAWVRSHPALADAAAPGPAFADGGSRTIALGSECIPGPAWPGCYGSASASANDPLTDGFALVAQSRSDLVAGAVAIFANSSAGFEPIIEDDHARGISWGYANAGGAAPIGTVVVAGWGFLLEDSFVGHALQGLNLCGTKDVTLRGNQLGLTGCDTVVLCGTAANLTIDGNVFCGAGYFCPNARGKRSENMVGLFDLSADAISSKGLNYIPAAGIFGGYPEIRLARVSIVANTFSDSSCALPWTIGPSFAACGNGLDLTGINTLGLGKAGTDLYWGPRTFASSSTKQCYPAQCALGSAGCFDSARHCVESTGFAAPAFADSSTKSCSPTSCTIDPHDKGCFDSLESCLSANPTFTDVTRLRFDVSNNTLEKGGAPRPHACPVGDPAPPTLCSSCDASYPVDIWKGYNKHACNFTGNTINWDGKTAIFVHY